jgi:coenzyme F420-reducing hydrogenase delta subunit/NAD-dependent dihydropyrimidine dehydrogenase PreA subunit
VDADSIVAFALQAPDVVHAEATDDLCGHGHAALAGDLVRRHSLDRLVVAACACCPLDQRCASCNDERAALREAVKAGTGLPWAHHAFVNVRDHAWATDDAITQVSMAIAYLANAREEVPKRATREAKRVSLVIGAGSKGRTIARELGERGVVTHLVDQASPAGKVETSPPNVTVHAPAIVRSLTGGAGAFRADLLEMGDMVTLEAGVVVIAPGLAEERGDGAIGWGIAHMSMDEPPRRVSGAFLAGQEGLATAGAAEAFLDRKLKGPEATALVDPRACIGYAKCTRVCPYGAIAKVPWMTEVGGKAVSGHVMEVDPLMCSGCGACPAVCPNDAMDQLGAGEAQLLGAIRAGLDRTRALFVVCNWSAYRAYDQAQSERMLPKGLARLVVPCVSRISPNLVLAALEAGADPLILAGCSETGCHFRGRRALLEQHVRHLEPGLTECGDTGSLFVLTLGPTDKDVLATRVEEAMEERRYARDEAGVEKEGGWAGW